MQDDTRDDGYDELDPVVPAAAPAVTGAPPALAGRRFLAVEVRGRALVEGTTVRVSFDEGRVGARAGGNSMTGAADWSTGVLVVGPMAMTRMLCPPPVEAQDRWLVDLLTASPTVVLDGATLRIDARHGGLRLVEEQDPQDPGSGRTLRA